MRSDAWLILMALFLGGSGCAYQQSFGEPIDDVARRAALLQAYPRPNVSQAVFRTLIRWGKREVSLTEVVKASPDGGLSVAGITDIGSTLYAAQIDPNGRGHIINKSIPFSNRWLLDGLIAELLIPWNGPNENLPIAQTSRQHLGIRLPRATHHPRVHLRWGWELAAIPPGQRLSLT